MTLRLETHDLHWLRSVDPVADLCAHGGFALTLDGADLVDARAQEWSLSAAAVHLLRTLDADHHGTARVGAHLVPCCGHAMFPGDAPDTVMFIECPEGVDFGVVHRAHEVELHIPERAPVRVPRAAWTAAVTAFADEVDAFYRAQPARRPADEHAAEGYRLLRAEWSRRRAAADTLP